MVHDDALRVARRAGGVVERDGLPFVGRLVRGRSRGPPDASSDSYSCAPIRSPGPVYSESSTSTTTGGRVQRGDGPGREAAEGAVDEQDLGLGVLEDERDRRGVEPGVERVPGRRRSSAPRSGPRSSRGCSRAGRRRCRRGRCPRRERRGEPPAPVTGRAPGVAARTVHDGEAARGRRRRSSRGRPAASAERNSPCVVQAGPRSPRSPQALPGVGDRCSESRRCGPTPGGPRRWSWQTPSRSSSTIVGGIPAARADRVIATRCRPTLASTKRMNSDPHAKQRAAAASPPDVHATRIGLYRPRVDLPCRPVRSSTADRTRARLLGLP